MRSQTQKAEVGTTRGKARSPRNVGPGAPSGAPRGRTAKAAEPRARLHRTPPARTGPIRDASMMFRSAPFSARKADPEPGKRAAKPESGGVKGAVEHSVEMAYRVIDELISRGRRTAGRVSHPSTKADPVRNNQMNLASMMMQTWMDMGRMWFGLMVPLMSPGNSPWQGSGFGGAFGREGTDSQHHHSATNAEGRTKVTLDLRSDRPTEVMIDLNHTSARMKKLTVQPLRDSDPRSEKPPIAGVDLVQHQDGSLRLSVNVPAGQPHGAYTGAIIAQDGSPVGGVTVKLHKIHGQDEPAA